jgi:alpha-L-fucosidase
MNRHITKLVPLALSVFLCQCAPSGSNPPTTGTAGAVSTGGSAHGGAPGGSGGPGGTSTGGSGAGGTGTGGSATGGASAGSGDTGGGGAGAAGQGGSVGAGGTGGGVVGTGGGGAGGTTTGTGGAGTGGARGGTSGSAGSGGAKGGSGGSGGTTGTGGAAGALQACAALSGGPTASGPVPTPAQLAFQRAELTSFIHYSMATYDGSEQGNPSDSPSIFNPSNLNATTVGGWTSALKGAGFRQAMLVTKHSVGFTIWPSKYTDYSIKSSPWMNGKGDVVQLFTDAMHNDGMRVALYLGPWDQKYPSSKSDYETYFRNQLTELLSYGPAYEIEFDGFNAPTSNVNWKSVFQLIKQMQPNILIWAGPEIVNTGAIPDVQWIGNENGTGSRTTSSLDASNCGGGSRWCPYECNTSSHRPNWFWHPNSTPMSLSDMQKVYFQTVGMNCTLNFNVPPSQTGEFDPKDISLLQQFGSWYGALYKTNVTKGQPATADSTWATAGFDAAKAADDDVCTYWAAASGKTTARLEVTPAAPVTANLISIREAIELGERVTKYHVEIKQNGTWTTAPTDKSGTTIRGTVIGQRQLWQLNGTSIQAIALVIESAKDVPAIAELDVY